VAAALGRLPQLQAREAQYEQTFSVEYLTKANVSSEARHRQVLRSSEQPSYLYPAPQHDYAADGKSHLHMVWGGIITSSYFADGSNQEQYIPVLNKAPWHQTNPSRGSNNPAMDLRGTGIFACDMAYRTYECGDRHGIRGVDGDRPGFLPGFVSALVCASLCQWWLGLADLERGK
jgi:hypothetical protein